MKPRIVDLTKKLMAVHRKFLANEREAAEIYFGRKIAPFEFLQMLTGDQNFAWLKPFSALIADIDAFEDEAEVVTREDLVRIKKQVEDLTKDAETTLSKRYQHHLSQDVEFIAFHAELVKTLNEFVPAAPKP